MDLDDARYVRVVADRREGGRVAPVELVAVLEDGAPVAGGLARPVPERPRACLSLVNFDCPLAEVGRPRLRELGLTPLS